MPRSEEIGAVQLGPGVWSALVRYTTAGVVRVCVFSRRRMCSTWLVWILVVSVLVFRRAPFPGH